MEDYLLIDGYNVINNWEVLRETREESFEHARDKLTSIVANYAGLNGVKAIIVFDAHHVKGGVEKQEQVAGVLIVYSKEGETADMVIERFMNKFPKNKIICVVTSDWVEQQIVLGKGAVRLSAREFWLRIQDVNIKTEKIIRDTPSPRSSIDQLVGEQVREILEKWRREN